MADVLGVGGVLQGEDADVANPQLGVETERAWKKENRLSPFKYILTFLLNWISLLIMNLERRRRGRCSWVTT